LDPCRAALPALERTSRIRALSARGVGRPYKSHCASMAPPSVEAARAYADLQDAAPDSRTRTPPAIISLGPAVLVSVCAWGQKPASDRECRAAKRRRENQSARARVLVPAAYFQFPNTLPLLRNLSRVAAG